MKVNLTLKTLGFFFVGDIGLDTKNNQTEVDLEGRSDAFVATIIHNILLGKLEASVSTKELLDQIKGQDMKEKVGRAARIEVAPKVEDVAPVEVEVKVDPVPVVEEVSSEVAPVVDVVPSADEVLGNLLDGGVRKVLEGVEKSNLSKEELQKLLDLEKEGKNRIAVKTVLEGIIG